MRWRFASKPLSREEAREALFQVETSYPGGRAPNLRVAQAIEGMIWFWSKDYLWSLRVRRAYRRFEAFLTPCERRVHQERRLLILHPEHESSLAA